MFGSGLRLGVGFVNPASPGWGLGWVCLGTVCGVVPLVSAVCGVRGWGSVSACLWDVYGCVGAPLAPRRLRFRRALWACVLGPGLGCAQPFLAGLSGCVFCAFVFLFFFCWVSLSRALWSLSPHPLSFGLGCWLFFFFVVCVCLFRCPFSRWAAVPGLVLPVLAGWSPCASLGVLSSVPSGGGGLAASGGVGGRFGSCGLFSRPPPSPLCFFFLGGGPACSSLCPPWAGARTGPHSVLSSGLLLSVAFCLAAFRPHGSGGLCTQWARRPFLPDYPHHCSPCFLVAKPGSTALRLVVDYVEVNKKTQNHSGSIPNMENTLERIAKCRYKTKMDKRSGFWQLDPTAAAQELLAFITRKGPVFKWKVMPFGVANAPALFQKLMNKTLYILRRRPLVQELISRGAEMEALIDDVSLGTNTQEDHVLLLREFFIVCQEKHLRIKLGKCEFIKEEMEYLGFDVGYGWWKPAASKMQPLQDMQIRDDPEKGLHDVRSFTGACNFYWRHIHNFAYSSAPLTDLIKKTNPWRWTAREKECFQELKKKIASSNCLGVPRPKGEIVLITDASDVGGGETIYQRQDLKPAELTHLHYRTSGLNRDGSLKHDYPTSEWRLVPLGHWNRKWNQARSNYKPMTRNSWPVCWCFLHNPDSWDLTLLSGSVTRNL